MKYHLITYGCQMNTADSEEMAQPLAQRGLTATPRIADADIILMNTCTVRDQAEHRAQSNLGRLRAWKAQDPKRILIVAGCAASRWGDSIRKRYPYIDAVSPATKIEEFPNLINQILKERWNWHQESELVNPSASEPETSTRSPAHSLTGSLFGDSQTAYVTIMRGCNYSCSYCIVPQVRGREVYRDPGEICSEIQTKVSGGTKEAMLLGQTVNSYYYREPAGNSPIYDFADLLRDVNAIEGLERIRFMSPHPKHMRDRVIEAMRDCEKVCRHIHLPVQSGSDRLLTSMKRLYTREQYLSIIKKLRSAMPGIMITTDIIVGYPSEDAADLEETLRLLDEVQFDGLFAFKYSPRPGTASAGLPDEVPAAVKEERLQQVLAHNRALVQGKRA